MKRITACLLCLAMLLSSIVAFAENTSIVLNTVTITYANNANESADIVVSGSYDKSVVLRIFDHNGALEYIGTANPVNGVFELDKFKLEKPDTDGIAEKNENTVNPPYKETSKSGNTTTTKYTVNYRAVVSSDNVKVEQDVTIVYFTISTDSPGPGPGPNPIPKPTPTIIVCEKCGWEKCTCEQPIDKPIVPGGEPAYIPDENYAVVGESGKVTTPTAGAAMIDTVTKATSPEAMAGEAARNTIAMSVQAMMANISSKRISTSSSTNTLVLKADSVSDSDLKKYTDTEKTLNAALDKNKITLNRNLIKEYIVNTTFSTAKKATVAVYKGFVEKLEKVGIETLTINDAKFRVSYSLVELKKMIGEKEFTSFDIDTTAMSGSSKKLAVSFDTDKTQSVKISFPGLSSDAKYMAIVDENGNPVGGRYNPATGAIEAKISESGVYQVVNNEKDFEDIKHLSEEMQESIKILAAKGIIEGTSPKEFSPEDTISRAEVAALLLRVLAQVDPNADGGFADVKKSDWFYGTAGSSKNYGMILGYNDNTFRGNTVISKDQILTVASRVLKREMKYITPDKPEEWLTFADASSIANWAKNDIALATMANIVTRTADNTIHANENMTRGDAALIIMRLFYKIW